MYSSADHENWMSEDAICSQKCILTLKSVIVKHGACEQHALYRFFVVEKASETYVC